MPRNQLKRFPISLLRRGVAHFHPASRPSGRNLAALGPRMPPAGMGGGRVPAPAKARHTAGRGAGSRP
jgi:hypothetical protein